jgi:hypothetical protein
MAFDGDVAVIQSLKGAPTMGVHHTKQQTQFLIERGIERIRELSIDGVAPSTADFNANRGTAPSADYMRRKGYPWPVLLEMAGVQGLRPGAKPRQRYNSQGNVPEDVEAEIVQAFHRGDHRPLHWHDWPLQVIPTRVEQSLIPQQDGTVLKITRYYASIR